MFGEFEVEENVEAGEGHKVEEAEEVDGEWGADECLGDDVGDGSGEAEGLVDFIEGLPR